MLVKFCNKIFGSRNDRILRRMRKIVKQINYMEPDMEKMSDYELKGKTQEFRSILKKGALLESILPKAFAVVREASKRIFGMRHFDVQLLGGIVLNDRCIAEMRTGEGKTLTATLPAYLNALSGSGVHVVTVNDYLAKRDAEKNRPIFEFLGLSVGINTTGMLSIAKRKAYAADITYGTNNEYCFDYLRDNMVLRKKERVQRPLHYALVDEVDSILIDESRTPLIISGTYEESAEMYLKINQFIPQLIRQEKEESDTFHGSGHFSIDEKARKVHWTERGLIIIEEMLVTAGIIKKGLSLYSTNHIMLMHHVTASLRAHMLFTRDVDYIVKNNKVIIVDEHTGRIMHGRRWSDGLHQAVEAKEFLSIQKENNTLASITFQNYFRLYEKLAGMTGTADTESLEFHSIYKLDTIVIPTHRPMIRKDMEDVVYMTEKEKMSAIIEDISERSSQGQPVLVGTISIEKSEAVSNELTSIGISHKILNAKFHSMESDIIAQAGQQGAVTIATHMAGRGTDIVLGGCLQEEMALIEKKSKIYEMKKSWKAQNDAVRAVGGLHIIGTERHESRRIDNQLRGRSGRQGDAGSSRFYLSMEDALMRIFSSDIIYNMIRKMGIHKCEAMDHPWVTKSIANAQRKMEIRNFEIRKQLLEYDDVANHYRHALYFQRNILLDVYEWSETISILQKDLFKSIIDHYIPSLEILENIFQNDFRLSIPIIPWFYKKPYQIKEEKFLHRIIEIYHYDYQQKEKYVGLEMMRTFKKILMLQALDSLWKEHISSMDYLRKGIHLRGYAQKDPKQEYKRESFFLFSAMLSSLKYEVISILSKVQVRMHEEWKELVEYHFLEKKYNILEKYKHIVFFPHEKLQKPYPFFIVRKISRNNNCICGSGKKYKQCHGIPYRKPG